MAEQEFRYSIVVPVYNESEVIGDFMRSIRQLPPDGEVIVVYDFPEDDTLPAIAALPSSDRPEALRLLQNRLGRGVRHAIEAGMRAAGAPVVIVMMADLSDDLSVVPEMIRLVEEGAGVVCASRYVAGGKQVGGGFKALLSRFAGVSLHALGALPVHDATNSFRAYSREFLRGQEIESPAGFAMAFELTVKACEQGLRVVEVPATWEDRTKGASKFRLWRWLPIYLRWYFRALRRRRPA